MQAAFIALERAKRDAEARLRQCEAEGRKSAYKLSSIRHDIREYEEALRWLKWANDTRLVWVRLWTLVEEGNRNSVQIHSSTSTGRRKHRQPKGR